MKALERERARETETEKERQFHPSYYSDLKHPEAISAQAVWALPSSLSPKAVVNADLLVRARETKTLYITRALSLPDGHYPPNNVIRAHKSAGH